MITDLAYTRTRLSRTKCKSSVNIPHEKICDYDDDDNDDDDDDDDNHRGLYFLLRFSYDSLT